MNVLLFCVADYYVVLAERKLTSYVYAVGKQPMSNNWYEMVGRGGVTVKCGNEDRYAFCDVIFYLKFEYRCLIIVNMFV